MVDWAGGVSVQSRALADRQVGQWVGKVGMVGMVGMARWAKVDYRLDYTAQRSSII